MCKYINKTKKGILILVAVMLLTIPNMPIYSAAGSYSTSSPSLVANSNNQFLGVGKEGAAWWQAAASVVAASYVAGRAIGTVSHHVYHLLDGHPIEFAIASVDYSPTDFSKFDN